MVMVVVFGSTGRGLTSYTSRLWGAGWYAAGRLVLEDEVEGALPREGRRLGLRRQGRGASEAGG